MLCKKKFIWKKSVLGLSTTLKIGPSGESHFVQTASEFGSIAGAQNVDRAALEAFSFGGSVPVPNLEECFIISYTTFESI
jgi:hypothetical protein